MTLQTPYLIVGRQFCEDAFQVRRPASNTYPLGAVFFLFFSFTKPTTQEACSRAPPHLSSVVTHQPGLPTAAQISPQNTASTMLATLPYRWRLPEAGPSKPGYYKTSHVEITERMFARPVYRLGSGQSTSPAHAPCGTCRLSEQARVQTERSLGVMKR